MAKKSRTPPPPRRPAAARPAAPGADRARRRRIVLIAAGLVVVVAVAAGIAFAVSAGGGGGGGDEESAVAALRAAGCTYETAPSMGRQHVEELAEDFEYNTFPPTTGPHHPTPAVLGIYDRPVPQIHVVHALEHGVVAIQYGEDVPAETVDAITAFYREDPNGLIVAPLPELGDEIALTAWTAEVANPSDPASEVESSQGRVARCTEFDEQAFTAFRDAFRYQGPERFPEDALQPGS